jgi:hypothetical protein
MTKWTIPHINIREETKIFWITLINLTKGKLVSDTENVMTEGSDA